MALFKYAPRRFRRRRPVATAGSTKSMCTELQSLGNSIPDPTVRKAFDREMQSFFDLYSRYLKEKSHGHDLEWEKIGLPTEDQIVPYNHLPTSVDSQLLKKLAVLKVNGGLGTTMNLAGAKSALEVKPGMSFLDLIVRQIQHLNSTHRGANVPLILMTSFHTQEDTMRVIRKYANQQIRITSFYQSRYPKVLQDTLLPWPKDADEDSEQWYPPGHGDLYTSLFHSGVLDQLLAEGKEYLFVSNSDNLGAVVDQRILQYMSDNEAEFLMEVTDKTKADIKGGTLVQYEGSLRLLEIAQVPAEHVDEFTSVRKFSTLNTNNLWINLKAVKRVMENGGMELDLITEPKAVSNGQTTLQLKTAAGAAIKHFKNAHAINVSRDRFLPVKNCSDLLLIKSDVYTVDNGRPVVNENRIFGTMPVIKLGDHFKNIQEFHKRFKRIPKIIELDHLTVTGDVYFGQDVTLRGTVIIVANDGQRIDVPDGCLLENRLLSGNFKMIEL